MNNKGPILISYLAQIILLIILLQVSNWLKGLTVLIILVSELLIIWNLARQPVWNARCWYAFCIFALVLAFTVSQAVAESTSITIELTVGLIIAVIIGFLITTFKQDKKRPLVDVVDLEPKIETIDMPKKRVVRKTAKKTAKKTTKKKRTTKKTAAKKPAKKKTSKKK